MWGLGSARLPSLAEQGNLLLLIILSSAARMNSAHWHFLSFTFPVQIPCCFWMLAIRSCVHLPLFSTSQEECHIPILFLFSLSVFLFLFFLLPLTPRSCLQPAAALSWRQFAGNAQTCIFLAEELWCCSSPQCTFCSLSEVALHLPWSQVDVVCLLMRFVSQTSLAAPCHCPKQTNSSCFYTIICTFLAFLTLS